ncbi:RmlC-like jelly roll fold [Acididesulfobacillus acetoxydans]|uniref:RmlC-like jelly roll fold n=1 Tax=Acididesulfobacillus acetoxydans TaxID=1561005 RepID=A0A8S0Y3Z5_9FIRM|nr:Crp/Fnr family transcriptional regulator [Acididesulfobacillus acetoxydans]CAA7602585.1 RmlC-like jelly roll fold [Acididesulfobacillus acetoxydans]CEJ07269.1 Transcriptional regulator, Crp/Fnr [Acididesulfobacillus acetoxydans]
MAKCINCLKELELFRGLEKEEFANVCLAASKQIIEKGSYLFTQGEPADTLFLVKGGKLKLVQLTEGGREIIVDILGQGEVLGETVLFQREEHLYSAKAIETTKVCSFSMAQFETVIKSNPALAVKMISHLGQKLYEFIRLAGEITGTSARERLLHVLHHLADEHGRPVEKGILIELDLTQQELADMIGVSRVKVAQIIGGLKESGVIQRKGKSYFLASDPCLLRNFPEGQ